MRQQEQEAKLPNNIQTGTKITGNIETTGDFRIDGNIAGNVNSKGKVVIGAQGFIKGEVICTNAEISGTLEGKIVVSELLSLKSTSKITGEIKIGKLSIEPGAFFSGTCSMSNQSVTITPEKK
ncbi:MAG: polymer-forming cytoskeletal protein [Marinilabiliaceae bacterium]|nr:polymer-forming cytoskeletal protein [Marinilabiliaceae bacterium]